MAERNRDWNERYATRQTPWDSGRPSRELERVLGEGWFAPGRALELGCGTGTNAIFLAARGFDVTAVDVASNAIEAARRTAADAGARVRLEVADALNPPDLGPAFPLVFDRGVYHVLREVNLEAFLRTLEKYSAPGGHYLTLAGNANDPNPAPPGCGPPTVRAETLCRELETLFDMVQLRQFQFDAVNPDGSELRPLAWSALLRRREGRR
jgi:SAM-dependent methyltransferase